MLTIEKLRHAMEQMRLQKEEMDVPLPDYFVSPKQFEELTSGELEGVSVIKDPTISESWRRLAIGEHQITICKQFDFTNAPDA